MPQSVKDLGGAHLSGDMSLHGPGSEVVFGFVLKGAVKIPLNPILFN
jgi:hypothetical protein